MQEVIIVGAGLSGLSAAYYLKKKGVNALVLEGRDRWGGRIETVTAKGNATPVEMGATWFAKKHTYLMELLKELEIPIFKQYQKGIGVFETELPSEPQYFQVPDSEEPSFRIRGGTSRVTDALVHHIGRDRIILNSPITNVTEFQDYIEIITSKGEKLNCRNLAFTIPPFLILSQKIVFDPVLPAGLDSILRNTHTWMGDAIKFAVEYKNPFWRHQGYSGTVFSHYGIAPEMYDHSNFEDTCFALKGFLTSEAFTLTQEERELRIIEQLTRLLGKDAANYISYTEKLWRNDPFTFADYRRQVLPHQYNGHPLYEQPLMNGKLYLAGTETSPYFGGYMDGAVYSGLFITHQMLDKVSKK